MNLNNFTIKSQEAIQAAQQLAFDRQNPSIETAHLLEGVFQADEDVTPYLLKKLNVNVAILKQALQHEIDRLPKQTGAQIYLSADANNVLLKAQSFLKKFGDEFVSIEHLLLGILAGKDSTAQMLKDAGVTEKDLMKAITELRKGETVKDANAESGYNALNK